VLTPESDLRERFATIAPGFDKLSLTRCLLCRWFIRLSGENKRRSGLCLSEARQRWGLRKAKFWLWSFRLFTSNNGYLRLFTRIHPKRTRQDAL
jgi:hypothetical protein